MTGKASSAKTAVGDEPVFGYIVGLPQPQRAIAERGDAPAAKLLPDLKRGLWWGRGEGPACGISGCQPTLRRNGAGLKSGRSG